MKKAKQIMTKKFMAMMMTFFMVLSVLPQPVKAESAGGTFGTKSTALAAGTYIVPLQLKHATNLDQDSKAASCPGRYGTLTVNEDGSAKLKVKLRSVTVGLTTDWADKFKLYQGKLGTAQSDVTVTKKETKYMLDNGKQGKAKEVPTEIEINIPEAMKKEDGVYLNMHVEAMNDSPDAFLQIDYANAKAEDDKSLNYTTEVKTVQVDQFGKYNVTAKVTVTKGEITDVDLNGTGFNGTHASDNEMYLNKAINGTSSITGMKDKLIGLYDTDENVLNDLDTVSGATYSSDAIKEAVMNALGITVQKEVIPPAATEIPEAGIYTIDIKNTTDVVAHSLVGGKVSKGDEGKQRAILKVDDKGKMTLTYKMINSTKTEPLQVLGFNGYYTNNDKTNGKLTMDGVSYKRDRNDSSGLNVVTDVTIPLDSTTPQQYYYTNNYLYVEAMKALGADKPTETSGILFDKGKFNIDSKITLYWDGIEGPFTKAELEEGGTEFAFLDDGTYVIDGSMVQPNGEKSMSDGAITHKLKLTVKDGKYTITMNFKGMNIGSLRGYLKNLSYYKEGYTTDIQNNPEGEKEAVKVESVQKYKDGSTLSDSLGTDYPDIVSFDVIPEAMKDGVIPMQVFVPIMESITAGTGTKNVYLTLDWNSLKATTADDTVFNSEDVIDEKPSTDDKKPVNNTAATTIAQNNTTKPAVKQLKKGTKYTVSGNVYQATSATTVSFVKAANKKSVTVPATVTVGGVKASVTAIGNKAFSSAKKKLTSVRVGSNVTTIGSKAFNGCKKLKKITVSSTKLKKVGSKALSGIHKKAVIKVPKSKKKAYTKLFKNKGQKKTVKVK